MNKNIYPILGAIGLGLILALVFVFGGGTPPEKPKSKGELKLEDSWVKGSKEAKIQLVEFSDFQCPACGLAEPEIKKVLENYGDNIALTYRHFPLPQHKQAFDASRAAEAAGKQGKFWEMHDKLFINQSKLSSELYSQLALELALNPEQFKVDFESQAVKDRVEKDRADAQALGVNSTPTFYINGEKVEGGGLKFEDWKKLIDSKL